MKNNIVLATFLSAIAALGMITPARGQLLGQSSIGPSVLFGNGQAAIGIDSKFGISDNLSLRPFVYFANSGTDFGTAITYDIPLRNTEKNILITPFVGAAIDISKGRNSLTTGGLVAGADLDFSDSLRVKASLIVPLSTDQGQTTGVTVGAGFRF